MKENLRKLALISRVIDLDLFYCVTFFKYELVFHGKYSSDIVAYLKGHNFTLKVTANGFTRATRSNIRIVLS